MLIKENNESNAKMVPNSGQIQLILGPMFSGKTTELMRRVKRYQMANHSCVVVKYANDNRYETNALSTHDRITLSAISATKLADLRIECSDFTVIGIDEGQFFPDVVDFAEQMANIGKIVMIAALDGSYQRLGFNDFLRLIPLAENVIKLTAVCMKCYADAFFTKRKGNETALEVIGGTDKYLAVCRRCYFEENTDKE